MFGQKTLNPVLWYVNRKSITRAIFVGTFFGLLPIPFHSVFIVMAVLLFEVNLPISLMLAWLSNPLTLAPILYIGFWFGAHIYHVHMINKKMLLGVLHQISRWITHFGHGHIDLSLAKILISGLIVEAFVFATILYIVTEIFWRWMVIRNWKNRTGHKKQEDAL
ncbi:DUF2062 domain-containing protein [Acinetobacter baumannii]|nr:DUF2062 domain-containing protein [Acinetobacter baumannii]